MSTYQQTPQLQGHRNIGWIAAWFEALREGRKAANIVPPVLEDQLQLPLRRVDNSRGLSGNNTRD